MTLAFSTLFSPPHPSRRHAPPGSRTCARSNNNMCKAGPGRGDLDNKTRKPGSSCSEPGRPPSACIENDVGDLGIEESSSCRSIHTQRRRAQERGLGGVAARWGLGRGDHGTMGVHGPRRARIDGHCLQGCTESDVRPANWCCRSGHRRRPCGRFPAARRQARHDDEDELRDGTQLAEWQMGAIASRHRGPRTDSMRTARWARARRGRLGGGLGWISLRCSAVPACHGSTAIDCWPSPQATPCTTAAEAQTRARRDAGTVCARDEGIC